MRIRHTVLIVLLIVVATFTGAAAQVYFMPLREIARQGYITFEGTAAPRYQFRYVRDEDAPETCVLVLTDETTGRFAITTIPAASCAARDWR